jgi:pyridoxal phosphate enzyme (YggS family)
MPSPARAASLISNFQHVTKQIASLSAPQPVRLLLVSKLKPASDILALHTSPLAPTHFGENYVQELQDKAKELPKSIKWHFIGGLQSNKCKGLAEGVANLWCVSSVDTVKKADLLDKGRAAMLEKGETIQEDEKQLRVMVQVNTSGEDSKSGVSPDDAVVLCRHVLEKCQHLRLHGLMTIGAIARSKAAGEGEENEDFRCLVQTRERVAKELGLKVEELELSMGMSADFEGAIVAGSNEVRVGSTIFGERPSKKETDSNATGG